MGTLNADRMRLGLYSVVALAIGMAAAWATLDALDGQADDLVRHARVDAWTTQQTESQSYQFLLAVSEHVAGHQTTTLDEIARWAGDEARRSRKFF